jgi:hypothetical protein
MSRPWASITCVTLEKTGTSILQLPLTRETIKKLWARVEKYSTYLTRKPPGETTYIERTIKIIPLHSSASKSTLDSLLTLLIWITNKQSTILNLPLLVLCLGSDSVWLRIKQKKKNKKMILLMDMKELLTLVKLQRGRTSRTWLKKAL